MTGGIIQEKFVLAENDRRSYNNHVKAVIPVGRTERRILCFDNEEQVMDALFPEAGGGKRKRESNPLLR